MDARRLKEALLHWLWPRICAHCREDLPRERPGPLCLPCRLTLVPDEPPFCLRCAVPVRPPNAHCPPCSKRLHACGLIRSAFLYRGAAVSLAHAFKYRGGRRAAAAAGAWMGLAFSRFPELGRPEALVPVPLHPRRLSERGYNQAELLARGASEATRIPVEDILIRRRDTRPQWNLDRSERLKNLAGGFALRGPAAGRSLLLIDDVCTSTASLEGCARALEEAGAARVCGYVFARQEPGRTSPAI